MILPANLHFKNLIVSADHIRILHAGSLIIASLREKYWIPRIRNLVKTVIHLCFTCYKLKAEATQQFMCELPSARVQPSRPFFNTGVDYAGPISLRVGTPSSKTIIKGYIAPLMWCGSLPNYRHHYLNGFRCHQFGQYYDILILYNIFYNNTTLYINIEHKENRIPIQSLQHHTRYSSNARITIPYQGIFLRKA